MFGDDSKLRLRKSIAVVATSAGGGGGGSAAGTGGDCEEGYGGMGGIGSGGGGLYGGMMISSVPSSDSCGGGGISMDHHHHPGNNHHLSHRMVGSSLHPPSHHQSSMPTLLPKPPPALYGQIKGRRKRRRRREVLYRYCQLCWRGVAATIVSTTLSLTLVPWSWHAYEVDYHHQVQHEIEHLVQVLEDSRRNTKTILRGVHIHKSKESRYKVITCSDLMTIGFENDNYCDCPDGKDETKTSACSHLLVGRPMFVCGTTTSTTTSSGVVVQAGPSSSGVSPVSIFASRVGDGIVDCPDGSDEKGIL